MAFIIKATAVVVTAYEYDGSASIKPNKEDMNFAGDTIYVKVTQVGDDVVDFSVGDIVTISPFAGKQTKMDGVLCRLIDETDILYKLA